MSCGKFTPSTSSELRRRNWIDRADVLQLAIKRLETDPGAIGDDVLVIVPADLDTAGLERRLLESLPAKRRIDLPVDQPAPATASRPQPLSDARLLRWLPCRGRCAAAIRRRIGGDLPRRRRSQ